MHTHAAFDSFVLDLDGESIISIGKNQESIAEKAVRLKAQLLAESSLQTADGELAADAVVLKAASLPHSYQDEKFVQELAKDGFVVMEDGKIRRMPPNLADVVAADDEVHALLEELDLAVLRTHLDHAIDLRGQRKWEPANGELRKVLEGIFDEATFRLEPSRGAATKKGENRRQLLASLNPPFLIEELGEWGNNGKNFVNGVLKRLQPEDIPAFLRMRIVPFAFISYSSSLACFFDA